MAIFNSELFNYQRVLIRNHWLSLIPRTTIFYGVKLKVDLSLGCSKPRLVRLDIIPKWLVRTSWFHLKRRDMSMMEKIMSHGMELFPNLNKNTINYFTSCDPHHDIYTFCYWQIFWHSIRHIFWHSIWHIFRHSTWHTFCQSMWHIFWHSIWHILRHFIWHIFWHFIWHIFWHFIWHIFGHSIWHIFWHSIWHFIWHSLWHTFWHSI